MTARLHNLDDTIAAISTPPGAGGIGIVRMSGPDALAIADKIFWSPRRVIPSEAQTHSLHYGRIKDAGHEGEFLDEVLLAVMRAPHTYTTEDVVEIHCHGGQAALTAVLNMLLSSGARLADPGEFTKRAFLHGRIDLTQAEAVLDIIHARTDAFLRMSTHQLKGDLATELENVREALMRVYTRLEAMVNFPEDDTGDEEISSLLDDIISVETRVKDLVASGQTGRILKEGIKVVLCGKPNVGKSSLLNVLLKTPRAIVSEIAGTTRDTIEEFTQIQGIPFHVVDTAGILEPRDLVEEEAVRRSRMSIQTADLILFMLDGHSGIEGEDRMLAEEMQGRKMIVVVNKCDLDSFCSSEDIDSLGLQAPVVRLSVLTREGMETLQETILKQACHGTSLSSDRILLSNVRHIQALRRCAVFLKQAQDLLRQKVSYEFVSEDMKLAVHALDSITGRDINADLLDQIFAHFCIGK